MATPRDINDDDKIVLMEPPHDVSFVLTDYLFQLKHVPYSSHLIYAVAIFTFVLLHLESKKKKMVVELKKGLFASQALIIFDYVEL